MLEMVLATALSVSPGLDVSNGLSARQTLAQDHRENALVADAEKVVDEGWHPGYVSIVAEADGTIRTNCHGWADAEARRALTPKTMFWCASMTKGIVGALFAQLAVEGVLNPDDPGEKYIPELAALRLGNGDMPKRPPTLRHFMTHTSGLPFKLPDMEEKGNDIRSMRALAAALPGLTRLVYAPGTSNIYSNLGIDVAAACMENATGCPFDKLLKERFFDPLGMVDATFCPTDEQYARMAKCYRICGRCPFVPGTHKRAELYAQGVKPRHPEAGGGLYMTAPDMFAFYWALAHHGVGRNGRRVLSERAIALLRTKQTPPGLRYAYSFGMNVDETSFGHGGMLGTDARAWPDTGVCKVWFVQLYGRNGIRLRNRVWK